MSKIWNLYFSLQMYVYLAYIDIDMPYLADIILTELKKMVEFYIFTIDGFTNTFIDPDFNLASYLKSS